MHYHSKQKLNIFTLVTYKKILSIITAAIVHKYSELLFVAAIPDDVIEDIRCYFVAASLCNVLGPCCVCMILCFTIKYVRNI